MASAISASLKRSNGSRAPLGASKLCRSSQATNDTAVSRFDLPDPFAPNSATTRGPSSAQPRHNGASRPAASGASAAARRSITWGSRIE